MYFYEVFVTEPRYQKREPLTYSSTDELRIGAIVCVPYGNKSINGFVAKRVNKPEFKTKRITDFLPGTVLPDRLIKLHKWIISYYPSGSGAVTQLFIPSGLSFKNRKNIYPTASKTVGLNKLPELTDQQKIALKTFEESDNSAFILHGETGSGKTRVYLEQAAKALKSGRSVIVLTPEISLITQLEESFKKVFGDKVITYHSGLTKSVRRSNWLRMLSSKEPLIVIGTRSAAFSPLKTVGFTAIDEMHEPAYKQDSAPRYNALRVSAYNARLDNGIIVYGSATPSVIDYYIAQQTGSPVIRLDKTALSAKVIERKVIDLKDKTYFSKNKYLSDEILSAIEKRLRTGDQSLLFLNRRGTARQIVCHDCGWQALCPRCDLPLTLHADQYKIRCHTCGWQAPPILSCPECSGGDIIYKSLGTKALYEDLTKLFPESNIQRFDTDNLAEEKLAKHYSSVQSGKIDILVGTQMLSKGLDLPKLSLVGIINADISLSMPDFSSTERSYQLLHQAIGRVGRGHKQAKLDPQVIIQSFNPNNPILEAACSQNWQALYEHELQERKLYKFPPFCHLLKITVSRKSSNACETYITKIHKLLIKFNLKVQIQDPVPSFYEKSHGKYNWQIVIKSKNRSELTKLIDLLPPGDYIYDLDPANLL